MMTRRSGPWTVLRYLLALPAIGLLVVAFAEPQVTMAQGAKTPGAVTTPKTESKQAQADDARIDEQKKMKELEKKMVALEKDYEATSDPEAKKAIKEKILQLRESFPQPKMAVDFSDPVSVEKALKKLTKSLDVLTAKSQDITDPVERDKFQQELDQLTKMQQQLKVRLAELKSGK